MYNWPWSIDVRPHNALQLVAWGCIAADCSECPCWSRRSLYSDRKLSGTWSLFSKGHVLLWHTLVGEKRNWSDRDRGSRLLWVGEGSLQQSGCKRRHHNRYQVVYFLFQVSIVFTSSYLMTLIHQGYPRPSACTVIKAIAQSCTQMHTMGHLLSPSIVKEASPPDSSWLKKDPIMCPSLTPKPHQCTPLIHIF